MDECRPRSTSTMPSRQMRRRCRSAAEASRLVVVVARPFDVAGDRAGGVLPEARAVGAAELEPDLHGVFELGPGALRDRQPPGPPWAPLPAPQHAGGRVLPSSPVAGPRARSPAVVAVMLVLEQRPGAPHRARPRRRRLDAVARREVEVRVAAARGAAVLSVCCRAVGGAELTTA